MLFSWLSLAVIVFVAAGMFFGLLPLLQSVLFSPRSRARDLDLPYECGIPPSSSSRIGFGINYYFYFVLFLAFDVDVLYLFPVAASYSSSRGWAVFWELLVFIAMLAAAVIYFWRKGVFTWPRKVSF